jgi:spore coat assembly protein
MEFKIGDLVTRNSYNNDMVFIIVDIEDDNYYLKGVNIRLLADSPKADLAKCDEKEDVDEEEAFLERVKIDIDLDRNDYFYLPGKILHIDGDDDYLNRCLKYYEDINIWAVGINENELNISYRIRELLDEYNPNIVVITGHDAYYKRKGNINDLKSYKNSVNFVNAIKEARKYEKSHEKLIIIAGACQSNYEELIKAGANFASSPKRVNIHALDPAIIASKMSLSDITKDIDLKGILENTKYGSNGIGGVKTKGTMYIGYPR